MTVPDDPQMQVVAKLMSPSGAWTEDLIKHTFIPVDAHTILSTSFRGSGADFWAWELKRHGLYSVRSAYRKLFEVQEQQRLDGRAASSNDRTWKRIWGICQCRQRCEFFWWRVVNNFLPTKGELHRRHIERIPNCDVCGADVESIKHVMMECTVAKTFWTQVRKFSAAKLPILHPTSWAHDLNDPALCSQKMPVLYYVACGRFGQQETKGDMVNLLVHCIRQ